MKVLKISSVWCPSCLIMNNVINKIKDKYNLEITSYDYDMDEEIVKNYNVGNILPVLIFLDDKNNEIKRIVGEKSTKELENILKELI